MRLQLGRKDLKPEFRKVPAGELNMDKFEQPVQIAILSVGKATFVSGKDRVAIPYDKYARLAEYRLKPGADTQEVRLSAYREYDLTGGGPLGHDRTFHAEIKIGDEESLVRNGQPGENLVALIEAMGEPVGQREILFRCSDYRGGYRQKYIISSRLTREMIGKEVPVPYY